MVNAFHKQNSSTNIRNFQTVFRIADADKFYQAFFGEHGVNDIKINDQGDKKVFIVSLSDAFWTSLEQADRAQVGTQGLKKGGIDFNPDKVNLETKGQSINYNLPVVRQGLPTDPAMLQQMDISGLTPVIIGIQPITDLPKLLGINTENVLPKPSV